MPIYISYESAKMQRNYICKFVKFAILACHSWIRITLIKNCGFYHRQFIEFQSEIKNLKSEISCLGRIYVL